MPAIRTLIVDDSALVRRIVTESLAHDPDIEVVGTAIDPYVARDKIESLNPDVITLDIEMPRMDGITFLKLLMKQRPMPVIIMSSLTPTGSDKALEALQAGAVDVIAKPGSAYSAADGRVLAASIKAAAHSKYRRKPADRGSSSLLADSQAPTRPPGADLPASAMRAAPRLPPLPETPAARAVAPPSVVPIRPKLPPAEHRRHYAPRQVILVGASTGGTEALREILTRLPPDLPGICVVQHIPAYFSRAFADRLNQICQLEVREAQPGDRVQPGLVLVAPGGRHMVLRWTASHYTVELNDGPAVHHQRPAVDVLFDSAVKAGAAPYALAVLLTGMGADGAAGMLRLRQYGASTVAQNEESCVVFGMPREAIKLGAAEQVLHLDQVPIRIDGFASDIAVETRSPALRA